jgi:hypothetical protein
MRPEITLTIVDRQTKRIVWRDKGVGRAGHGRLIGMTMVGLMDSEALEDALNQVLTKIPKRKTP